MSANPVSIRMAEEFPLLWAMTQEHDFAERLGGCSSPLHAEVDRALREIWNARNFMRDFAALEQAATNDGEDEPPTIGKVS